MGRQLRDSRMSYSRRDILSTGSALTALILVRPAGAAEEAYPSRPIEFIVPWGPGGGADQLARKVGKLAEPIVGQAMPVVNVPGGTGATGMAKLLAAPADGHSMAVYIADSHALLAGPNARWTMDDIIPVAVLIQAPSFLFVAQDSPFATWADFEKEAKENPGELKVATLGFGSVDDFTLKHLDAKGVKVRQVPFAKPSERYISILGGHADALFEQAGDVAQFINGKQMRPLIVFAEQRSAAFMDIPSSHELGYQVSLPQFRSIVVRAGTPPERVQALADALTEVAATAEYQDFLKEQFADAKSFLGATEAGSFLKEQLEAMRKLS
jgi:tripartite-type tricarboxylate transporter receptor subunit TctC